jgi:uncharacterized protein YlxP (DUF503 family)
MVVLSAEICFHIPDANSLKDKRQVCRSLVDGAKRKFNVAIAEVDTQDVHQALTIGIAVVYGEGSHAHDMLENVIRYLEGNEDAQLTGVERF